MKITEFLRRHRSVSRGYEIVHKSLVDTARLDLREKLEWRGPNGKKMGTICLSRSLAAAVLEELGGDRGLA